VVPRIALLRRGRLDLSLSYEARLTLPVDVAAGAPELRSGSQLRDRGEVLHHAEVVANGAATRNLSLRLRGEGMYGRVDLLRSNLYAEDALRDAGRLAWHAARASFEAEATPGRRTTISAMLAAFETGGADASARATAPLQRGGRVEAALRYALGRRDEVALSSEAQYARFTPALVVEDAAVAVLRLGWAHRLAPTLAGRVESGPAWSYTGARGAAPVRETAPFAELALTHTPARPSVSTELAWRMTPYMSPLTGAVEQRLEASATTTWQASRAWQLAARGAAAASRSETTHGAFWTGARQAELASVVLRASWAFARRGALSFEPRARWQRSHAPALPTFLDWGATVSFTLGGRWAG
jgi:hypothetical protein